MRLTTPGRLGVGRTGVGDFDLIPSAHTYRVDCRVHRSVTQIGDLLAAGRVGRRRGVVDDFGTVSPAAHAYRVDRFVRSVVFLAAGGVVYIGDRLAVGGVVGLGVVRIVVGDIKRTSSAHVYRVLYALLVKVVDHNYHEVRETNGLSTSSWYYLKGSSPVRSYPKVTVRPPEG